jgi:hypothetical protein
VIDWSPLKTRGSRGRLECSQTKSDNVFGRGRGLAKMFRWSLYSCFSQRPTDQAIAHARPTGIHRLPRVDYRF